MVTLPIPRCADFEYGRMRSSKHHSVGCRKRIYKAYKDNGDSKYRAYKHLFTSKTLPPGEDSGARGLRDIVADDVKHKEPFEETSKSQPHAPSAHSEQIKYVEPNHPEETWDFMNNLGDNAALDAEDQACNDAFSDLDDAEMGSPTRVEDHMVD